MTTHNDIAKKRKSIHGWKSIIAMTALLAVGLFLFPPLSKSGHSASVPQWALFFGRFHPIVVHLPVGVIILAALMESATFLKTKLARTLAPGISFVLGIGVFGAIVSAVFGSILARDTGTISNNTFLAHQVFCIAATLVALMSLGCKLAANASGKMVWPYRLLLGFTLLLMSVGAHFGGSMVHGNRYLTDYAPAMMKNGVETVEKSVVGLFGSAQDEIAPKRSADADPTVYRALIAPILGRNCASCHSDEKANGKLCLDGYDFLVKGGSDGHALPPEDPKNNLMISRILMPINDPEHMPPAKLLRDDEIALLSWWVQQGKDDTIKLSELKMSDYSKNPTTNSTSTANNKWSPTGSVMADQ